MITQTERQFILNEMMVLLDKYGYNYTLHALNSIIDEWADNKSDLIAAFKKHPNYVEGKFLIAFDQDYSREFDINAIDRFSSWLTEDCIKYMRDTLPEEINQQRINDCCNFLPEKLFDLLQYIKDYISGPTITSEETEIFNKIIPQIHPHPGQKTSRVINKICTYLNYNKHADYNREFAKFADALNPLTITRHTVLSINPLDYLTMSFGNSWSSCHTIDKENIRNMPNSYEGRYSSGTMSYMLDPSSMVFYTVDSQYNGNNYWTQPKINRQMFHYGEEKLVQGRLYPQSNDGCGISYAPYRQIVQSIMAVIFDYPNLWSLHKGSSAACKYINSRGTHYTDYEYYDNCSLSQIKESQNEKCFIVGANPICIQCGNRHDTEDNINCCAKKMRCEHCGEMINENDGVWVGDSFYCEDCVIYCDECGYYELKERVRYVNSSRRYVCDDCLDDYYYYCEDCGQYYQNGTEHYINDYGYVCPDCLEDKFTRCDECGNYVTNDEINELGNRHYCDNCYEEVNEDVSEDM